MATRSTLSRLVHDTRGVSKIEYGLLLFAILVLSAGTYKLLGGTVKTKVECAAHLGPCGGGGNGATASNGTAGPSSSGNGGTGGTPEGLTNGGVDGTSALALAGAPGQSGQPSFGDQVRGTEAKPLDATMADISADVYNDSSNASIDGFSRLSPDQLAAVGINPSSLVDPSTGFRAAIYSDGKGNYVLAYAGSRELKDWKTNFTQGLGFNDAQYNQAVALAKDAKLAFGDNLAITGHSLGGGLASTAAIATNSPAVTFNSSGINDNTLERLDIDPGRARAQAENGLIRRYAVDGEILTNLQEKNIATRNVMPDAYGKKYTLPDPNPLSGWQKWIPGARTKHSADLHGIGPVQESLRENPPWR